MLFLDCLFGLFSKPVACIDHVGPVSNRERRATTLFTLFDDQQTTLHVSAGTDWAGNAAVIPDGVIPAWHADDPTILAPLTPSADGLSCPVITTGKLGTVNVSASYVPPGLPTVSRSFAIQVVADAASVFEITADPPTSRIPAPATIPPSSAPAVSPQPAAT